MESVHPLSPPQRGMLLESAAAPGSGMYVEQLSFVLDGDLDLDLLGLAWRRLIDRHAMLRTAFVWRDQEEPLQLVLRHAELEMTVQDWRSLSPALQEARLDEYLESDRRRGFQLARPPLLRVAVSRLGPQAQRLLLTHHHVLMDGWSQSVLLDECLDLYLAALAGREPRLEPARPYADYLEWLGRQDEERARAFWRRALAGYTPASWLGGTGPGAGSGRSYGQARGALTAAVTAALRTLARRHRVTTSSLVQGAWALVLGRHGASRDVVFGATVSGRPPELPGIERTIGLFINTLPVRVRLEPEARFWPWLQQVQDFNVELREFEHTPASELNRWCGIPETQPLFQSVLVYESYPTPIAGEGAALDGRLRQVRAEGARTRYPVVVLVAEEERLGLQVVQDDRLDDGAAARLLAHVCGVLEAAAGKPDVRLAALLDAIPDSEAPRPRPGRPIGLAPQGDVTSQTSTQETLAAQWARLLGLSRVGIHDSFFDLGGHSQLVVRMIAEARASFGVDLPLGAVFESPTVAALAERIDRAAGGKAGLGAALVPLQERGDGPALYCAHPINGQVLCYLPLAGHLWPDQPLYGLQAADGAGDDVQLSIEDLAARYRVAVRRHQPRGPYLLGGWSMGGLIAFEMARQLVQSGKQVVLLAIIDTPLPATWDDPHDEDDDFAAVLRLFPLEVTAPLRARREEVRRESPEARLRHVRDTLQAAGLVPDGTPLDWIERIQLGYRARRQAVRRWEPKPYAGRITYFRGRDQPDGPGADPGFGWGPYAAEPVEVHHVPGDHDSLIAEPNVAELARALRQCLRRARR